MIRIQVRVGAEQVAGWLRNDTEADRRALQAWQETTEAKAVQDALLDVLLQHPPDNLRRQFLKTMTVVLLAPYMVGLWYYIGLTFLHALRSIFNWDPGVWHGILATIWSVPLLVAFVLICRHASRPDWTAVRASLLLARYDAPQALLYLLDCWKVLTGKRGMRSSQDDDATRKAVAEQTTRLLDVLLDNPPNRQYAQELRKLLYQHVIQDGRKRLTDEETDMYLAALRYLAKTDLPEDRKLLQKLSAQPSYPDPNREVLAQAAQAYLEPPEVDPNTIVASITSTTPSDTAQNTTLEILRVNRN
ncbi:MAG: hypothetical protein OHK0029_11860 [Armatimonadaceae bacterium]